MVTGRPSPEGVAIRLKASTHARVVLACESLNLTVSEFMNRAALASLQRQEEAGRVNAYALASSAAAANRQGAPSPEDFGLSRDYGISAHP